MAERVILHVGAMKSGTSYLQALIFAQGERLVRQGVVVPGTDWTVQARAVRQALGSRAPSTPRPRWEAFVAEVRDAPGDVLVSMEYLGPSGPAVAARIVEELGGRAEVVVTARDLNRSLVSMWQETVQNGRSWTWEHYLADVRDLAPGAGRGPAGRSGAGDTFWRQQHLVRMVRTWAKVVGTERVTLVTVPPPGAARDLLGRRFAEAVGLDLDLDAPVSTTNESLGLASILVLRRLNELLDAAGMTFPAGSTVRKRLLAKTVLAARRRDEPTLGLRVEDWVVTQSEETVAALTSAGVRLVGDWADLDPVEVAGVSPPDVPDHDVAEAALAGLAGLVLHRGRS